MPDRREAMYDTQYQMKLAINHRVQLVGALVALIVLAFGLAGCGSTPSSSANSTLQVIAGENFWGSIASQLGGNRVSVTSIVTNPNADPHDYETSTKDARAFATADYVILNGAGYDDWGSKMLDANPAPNRIVLTVADLLHKKAGDNPHFWYNPAWVDQAADRITADYEALDGADSSYFSRQRTALAAALQPYHDRIAKMGADFNGTAVGATESVVVYLAEALRLNLISPPDFMKAVSEGNDPPAASVAQFQNQLSGRQIKLLLYNVQTASNVTDALKRLASDNGIPVVGVSETLEPVDSTFQDWQLAQLVNIQNALAAQASRR